MPLGDRIKQLRKEFNWSQDELAKRIGADARQISRYENDKITPSADALIKLAEVFDVSIDFLLLENAARASLRNDDLNLIQHVQAIQELSQEDRASLFHIIDAMTAKNKMKSLMQQLI